MDMMQFRLQGVRFMVVGDAMSYNGNPHAEPMEPDTAPALLDLANERVQMWYEAIRAASQETPARGLTQEEQRAILERR